MDKICQLHDFSMDLMNYANHLKFFGMNHDALIVLKKACEIEITAAEMVENVSENEPSRSILFLSAASLAMQIGDCALAEYLAREGLNGFPTKKIKDDLNKFLYNLKKENICLI